MFSSDIKLMNFLLAALTALRDCRIVGLAIGSPTKHTLNGLAPSINYEKKSNNYVIVTPL